MASQDSGYYSMINSTTNDACDSKETFSSILNNEDYQEQLDKVLEFYEDAAKSEPNYLLNKLLPLGAFQIQCGISPARTFSPAITISQPNKSNKISFGMFEWSQFIDLLAEKTNEFFNKPLISCSDKYAPVSFLCGDFCTVIMNGF